MKAIASLLIAACALCASAHAQDSQATSERSALMPVRVGLHLASVHSAAYYNNSNPGIYAVWQNGLVLGALRNSLGVPSAYAGYALDSGRFAGGHLSVSFLVGAITGYKARVMGVHHASCDGYVFESTGKTCSTQAGEVVVLTEWRGEKRDVRPLVAPSLAWHASKTAAVRLTYMPKLSSAAAHVLHLSVEVAL